MSDSDEGRYQQILESIEKKYPRKLLLNVSETAPLLGQKRGTLYNSLSAGKCPIPVTRRCGRPRFLIHDIAAFLAS